MAPSALCSAHHTQRNRPTRPKVVQFVTVRVGPSPMVSSTRKWLHLLTGEASVPCAVRSLQTWAMSFWPCCMMVQWCWNAGLFHFFFFFLWNSGFVLVSLFFCFVSHQRHIYGMACSVCELVVFAILSSHSHTHVM